MKSISLTSKNLNEMKFLVHNKYCFVCFVFLLISLRIHFPNSCRKFVFALKTIIGINRVNLKIVLESVLRGKILVTCCQVVFSFIMFLSSAKAQALFEWERLYSGTGDFGKPNAIAVDQHGNSHIAGWLKEGTLVNLVGVVKYNSIGELQWAQTFSIGETGSNSQGLTLDRQGNVIVVGLVPGSAGYGFVIKYNSNGLQQWMATRTRTSWKYCMTDDNGSVYAAGETSTSSTSGADFIVAKYSSAGDEEWVRTYSGAGNFDDRPFAMTMDRIGNIYVSGSTGGSSSTYTSYATIKYSPDGTERWVRTYYSTTISGTNINNYANGMAVDGDGNVYVTGQGGGQGMDCTTIKYDSSGTEVWVRQFTGGVGGVDRGEKAAVDNSGNIIVSGRTYTGIATRDDIVIIKYSPDGSMVWNERFAGPTTALDIPVALAIDSDNNVYVTGSSSLGSTSQYVTLKYSSTGTLRWNQQYAGPGNVAVAVGMGLDTAFNVYVTGNAIVPNNPNSFNYFATIKYSQSSQVINITLPAFGEVVIGNEPYDIRWNSVGLDSLIIEFSKDSGHTFTKLAQNIPASVGRFEWMVPDTFSRKCIIRISNAADTTQRQESPLFKIKPYHLTRIDNEGNYEPYSPDAAGWQFTNSASNLWPQSWWSQFNYLEGIDPYTSQPYPDDFITSQPSDFPDWPLFVQTFGVDQCYLNTSTAAYSPTAINYWLSINHKWKGSCDGLSLTSLMAFDYQEQFQSSFPEVGQFTYLYDLTITDMRRKVINQIRNHFYGVEHLAYHDSKINKTPRQTLQELKDIFSSEFPSGRYLYMSDSLITKAHAVVPFRLERNSGSSGIYDLLIYDPNCPGGSCQGGYYQVVIDSAQNRWQYLAQNWSGGRFFLMDAGGAYFNRPTLPGSSSGFVEIEQTSPVKLFISGTVSSLITDSLGNTAGFRDSIAFSGISGVVPIVPPTSQYIPPTGFSLPTGNYSVQLNDFQNSTVNLSMFNGKQVFGYRRKDASIIQTDKINFTNGIALANSDATAKRVQLFAISRLQSEERMMQFSDCIVGQNDSLKLLLPDSNSVKVVNFNGPRTYTLNLSVAGTTINHRFIHSDIQLLANSSHIIAPGWQNLQLPVRIYVDIGNNGTIDDTLFIQNQLTGIFEDEENLASPNDFYLHQNYPNPFNPTTKISWRTPVSGWQTLSIYDVLGNKVAALVNEYRPAGSYEVEFDASGLTSGVYFYQLKAGDFSDTKKMLMLK